MEGEQIPKATMVNFLKSKIKVGFSADFTTKFLQFGKDYVNKLTEQANQICSKNDKKTINAQHIQSALVSLGLHEQLSEMKDISIMLKQQNQLKQEFRQRIQENIEKNLNDNNDLREQPRIIQIKNEIGYLENGNQGIDDDQDYQDDNNVVNVVQFKPQTNKKKKQIFNQMQSEQQNEMNQQNDDNDE